jgi:hypothetical protein
MDWTPNGTPPPLPLSQDPAARTLLGLGVIVAAFTVVVLGLLVYNVWH